MPNKPVLDFGSSSVAAMLMVDGQFPPQSIGCKGRDKRTAGPKRWLVTLFPPLNSSSLSALVCGLQMPLGALCHQLPFD